MLIPDGVYLTETNPPYLRRVSPPSVAELQGSDGTWSAGVAENNTAIVTLIKAHTPEAKAPAFVPEGDKFRNYASAWRDRWNAVMELFMAGGNYAASEVPFPKEFPEAVQAEIAAAK
jgi:hypothetical protein